MSARAELERVASQDPVCAIGDRDPSQARECGDGFVHTLARSSHHRCELFLRHGEGELLAVAGDLEQALRCTSSDVEERGVGDLFVSDAEASCEHADHGGERCWVLPEQRAYRLVRHRDAHRGLECSRGGCPREPIKERHLPEHVTWLHQREDRFSVVEAVCGDADTTFEHDEQRVCGFVFLEHDVVSLQSDTAAGEDEFGEFGVGELPHERCGRLVLAKFRGDVSRDWRGDSLGSGRHVTDRAFDRKGGHQRVRTGSEVRER